MVGSPHGHLWHPYTRHSSVESGSLPMILRGEGIYLVDENGRRFVDAISSWWCCALGHGNTDVIYALASQARELQHSILGNLAHPAAVELSNVIAHLMPDPDRHVLFASDGSSAVEQALKIAVQYGSNTGRPHRRRFACLQEGYHGDTFGAMSMGYLERFHQPFQPLLMPADRLPLPSDETWPAIEATLEAHAGEYAAVIVEPLVQGAAGMRMYPVEGLARLAAWCRDRQVLLIVDEIATGFGRTGTMFAFEHAGIDPDIVCLGKALAAGYLPLSATVVKDGIYASFADAPEDRTLQHGHTFSGNPICCAAALAALDVYCSVGFLDDVRRKAARLANAVTPLAGMPHVAEVRCLGLIAAVELRDVALARRARERLFEQGILLRPLGPVVYLMPPLTIEDDELADLAGAFTATLAAVGEL
jgi:adenosylmethionine-8-amino-7-oxononanoate aminotransferase